MVCHHNVGVVGVHDDGYKAMWKRDRDAAIARGEDPGSFRLPNKLPTLHFVLSLSAHVLSMSHDFPKPSYPKYARAHHIDCWTDAIVEAKIAARKENAPLKKLQRLLHKEKVHGAGGSSSRLSKEEEELAKARDKERILEDDEVTLY